MLLPISEIHGQGGRKTRRLKPIMLEKPTVPHYNSREMGKQRLIGRWRLIFLGLLIAGASVAGVWAWWNSPGEEAAPTVPAGIYGQDTPSEYMPRQLVAGLVLLRPEQLVLVPEVDGFQSPCGAPNGAFAYDAQPFGTPNERRGGVHLGQDLNGIGGENTDEGDAVYAAARGLVVYSAEPSPEWGNVVVLAHRLPGTNRIIQTLYAHLDKRVAKVGQMVARGEGIGTMGTAQGRYPAHLHFEAVESRCTEAGMPGYSATGTMNRLNPETLFSQYPAPVVPDPYTTIRRLRIREASLMQQEPAQMPKEGIPVKPAQFL